MLARPCTPTQQNERIPRFHPSCVAVRVSEASMALMKKDEHAAIFLLSSGSQILVPLRQQPEHLPSQPSLPTPTPTPTPTESPRTLELPSLTAAGGGGGGGLFMVAQSPRNPTDIPDGAVDEPEFESETSGVTAIEVCPPKHKPCGR